MSNLGPVFDLLRNAEHQPSAAIIEALHTFEREARPDGALDAIAPLVHAFAVSDSDEVRQMIATIWEAGFAPNGHMPAIIEALRPYVDGEIQADPALISFLESMVGNLLPVGTTFVVES